MISLTENGKDISTTQLLGGKKLFLQILKRVGKLPTESIDLAGQLNKEGYIFTSQESLARDIKFLLEKGLIESKEYPEGLFYILTEMGENVAAELPDYKTLEREMKISSILSREKPKFQSLGCGIQNGIFYFGIKIDDEKGNFYDVIITSDRKIYIAWKDNNEIKNEFGLNYRFPFFDDVIDGMWSRCGKFGIKNWLDGNVEEISLKQAFEKVLELNKWKVWHQDERVHKFVAIDIISTYFIPVFESHGRTLIYGETGFGKTRQTKIYQLLAFNPTMSVDFSDPSIFRIIESTKATILVDNFDKLEEEKKNKILHLFQTGYSLYQKAIRIEGKTFRPKGFDIYSHMVLNTILPLDEISENRSNIIRCLKADDSKYAKLEPDNPVWQETRDMLHICALQNYQLVQKIYDKLKEDRLIAREYERAIAILALAKAIDDKLYSEMFNFFIEENNRRKVRDLREDWLYNGLEYVIDKLGDKREIELSVKEIGEAKAASIFDEKSKDFPKQIHRFKTYLGKCFKANPLFPSRIKDGYSHYTFSREALIKFCKMKNFDELAEKLAINLKDFTT